MRNVCLRMLAWTSILIGLLSVSEVARAQSVQTLISFTNNWRYDQSGRELGTAWRTNSYVEDASWQGPAQGLLGVDTVTTPYTIHAPILTPLNVSPSVTTFYFRATFQFSGSTNTAKLVATNLVDDGCVIYLNGRFAGGIRNSATYTANSFFAGPGTEGQLDVTNLSAGLLRQGANQIAVEVHQSTFDSSDVMWGMKLMVFQPNLLAITSQPESQTTVVGDPVTFTAGVSGGPAFYLWQRNSGGSTWTTVFTSGSTVQGDNTSAYTIANPATSQAGQYRVVITNSLTSLTSSIVNLTVLEDTIGPVPQSATINAVLPSYPNGVGSNVIHMTWDETLTAAAVGNGARNTNNYQLILSANPLIRIPITNIQYNAALHFLYPLVTHPNWSPTNNYYLIINNVADLRGNQINPNTAIGVSRLLTTNLTQMSDEWNYYDCSDPMFCDPNSPAVYLNEAWSKTNFVIDPSYWGTGSGIFARESGIPVILCAGDQLNTTISFQFDPILFRRTFKTPTNVNSNGLLRLRFIVDDGMLVYLNGRPIYSNNVVGPITLNSRTTGASVSQATCTNIDINVSNLLPGTNWLAAAVVQHAVNHEGDAVFGLEMDLLSNILGQAPTNHPQGTLQNPLVLVTPRMVQSGRGTNFVISWPATNYGWALRFSTNIIIGTGPRPDRNWYTNEPNWQQVKDQSNPYTNSTPPVGGTRRFYQLYRSRLN